MPEAQILVARQEKVAQIRVIGRATFKISRELRDFGIAAVREGVGSMIIDLSSCQGMDSTFMGVLAMIGLEARGKAAVTLVNASIHHRRSLDGLGISRLFRFAVEEVPEVTWQNLCKAATGAAEAGPIAETIVDAHKTLMDASPENVPRFKDVVEMLSDELENESKSQEKDRKQ